MKDFSTPAAQSALGAARGAVRRSAIFVLCVGALALQNVAHAGQGVAGAGVIALDSADAGKTLFKATASELYRSSDDGNKWNPVALPPATGPVAAITVSPAQPSIVYVAGRNTGVLRSEDGGRDWTRRNHGLPSHEVVALAAHATQPETVYAYIRGSGIFRSQDGGGHWKLMDRGPREPVVGFVHSNMPGSMQTGWLFAATANGVRRSMDCFCGWQPAGPLKGAIDAIAWDPAQSRRVYAASPAGLFISNDGGEQWAQTAAPPGNITALTVSSSGLLYAASGGTVFCSRDQGKSWEQAGA